MTPQVPLATDSLHKFICLLGVALLLASLLGFYGIYTTTLERKVALVEEIGQLEAISPRSPQEEKRLELRRRVLDVTKSNEGFFSWSVAAVFALGLSLVLYGGKSWHSKGQALDDELKELQVRKLRAEVQALENAKPKASGASSEA